MQTCTFLLQNNDVFDLLVGRHHHLTAAYSDANARIGTCTLTDISLSVLLLPGFNEYLAARKLSHFSLVYLYIFLVVVILRTISYQSASRMVRARRLCCFAFRSFVCCCFPAYCVRVCFFWVVFVAIWVLVEGL